MSEHSPTKRVPAVIHEGGERLHRLYDDLRVGSKRTPSMKRGRVSPPPPADDDVLLQRMLASRDGAQIRRLWENDSSAYGGDESAGDLALCGYLAHWANGDAERIDQLFRRSARVRPKWDRPARQGETYGQGTIRIALESWAQSQNRHALPQIVVNNRQLNEVTHDFIQAIQLYHDAHPAEPLIYRRGAVLVRIVEGEEGQLGAVLLDPVGLRAVAGPCAMWVSRKSDAQGNEKVVQVFPPKEVVQNLAALADWPFPRLLGIVHCPTFAPDGTLHLDYGYNPATQLFNTSRLQVGDTEPSAASLAKATRRIRDELLGDFPFADQASAAHAVALLLLPFVFLLIDGPLPLFAVDAPKAGTGKGLMVLACAWPGLGRPLSSTPPPTSEAEWSKLITSRLLKGDLYTFIDNVNQALASAALAAATTQRVWEDRLLGGNVTAVLSVRQIWVVTSNNLVLDEDLARRTLYIRLDANVEHPDRRTGFRHANLIEWVKMQRAALVTAALTLIRNWLAQGRPRFAEHQKGSYEEFTAIMGGILQANGIEGFLENDEVLRQGAVTDAAGMSEFVMAWNALYGEQPVTPDDLFMLASRPDRDEDDKHTWHDLLADQLGAGTERSRRTKLGKLLGRYRDKIIVGYKIVKEDNAGKRPYYRLIAVRAICSPGAGHAETATALEATKPQGPASSATERPPDRVGPC